VEVQVKAEPKGVVGRDRLKGGGVGRSEVEGEFERVDGECLLLLLLLLLNLMAVDEIKAEEGRVPVPFGRASRGMVLLLFLLLRVKRAAEAGRSRWRPGGYTLLRMQMRQAWLQAGSGLLNRGQRAWGGLVKVWEAARARAQSS